MAFRVAAVVGWLLCVTALFLVPWIEPREAELTWPELGVPMWWATAAVLTAQAVVLWFASRGPVKALSLVVAVSLPLASLGTWDLYSLTSLPTAIGVYVVVLSAEYRRLRFILPTVVIVSAGAYTVAGRPGEDLAALTVQAMVQAAALVAIPAAVAAVVRARRDVRSAGAREHDALMREQEARVESAVARERTALARELHDIAAHHMSGIALMAAAIERQIDAAPAKAKGGARAIGDQSRLVLEDLRRLVGLLREGDQAEMSVYTLSTIPELVDGSAADVELQVHRGRWPELGTGIGPLGQLVAYRMVQESLANAVRHAPSAPCAVVIDDREEAALEVRVHNAPSSSAPTARAPGFGLRGMAERAELVGATLAYGPSLDGGWDVELRVPREATSVEEVRP
ncbi:hypothetical protein BHE97_11545 [Aeromicrobium sp. PE09-221]|nr:hypothetical protein BHE97_11545 [Aeromicrobium sp. PE09-221]